MSNPAYPTADELRAWLRLAHTDGIGPVRARILLQRFGPPEAILAAGPGRVAETLGSRSLANALFRRESGRDTTVSRALGWLANDAAATRAWHGNAPRRSILVLGDRRYPPRLLDLPDPPLLLYCVGDPHWLAQPQIAIVGSRNATALGAATARALAESVAAAGWTVASGMAEGIDRAAHQGALDAAFATVPAPSPASAPAPEPAPVPALATAATPGQAGSTVAALGTGVDRVYPSRHLVLARCIATRGALVSEQPIGMLPLPGNFPRRNRLIAALASGILVVEATRQSGSLITARLAADLGREVMAVPGSVHSPLARGCNSLIRQGAKLVECAEDILTELPGICQLGLRSAFRCGTLPPSSPAGTTAQPSGRAGDQYPQQGTLQLPELLPEEQARMLAVMSADPVMLETIAAQQCLPVARALAALQTLELVGLVQRQLDGSYIRCP